MSPLRYALLVMLGYQICFVISANSQLPTTGASPLWLGSGFMLGMVAAAPPRLRWRLLVVELFAHLAMGIWTNPLFAVLSGCADTVETGVGVWIIARFRDGLRIDRMSGLLRVALAGGVSTFVGAFVIVITIWLFNPDHVFKSWPTFFSTWMLGDLTAILALAPMIMTWRGLTCESPVIHVRHVLGLGVVVIPTAGFAFWPVSLLGDILAPSLLLPLLLWSALRQPMAMVVTQSALVAGLMLLGAWLGYGPFHVPGRSDAGISLAYQVFIATTLYATLILAAIAAERRSEVRARQRLADDRTATLASIGEGVVVTDPAGVIELLNAEAARVFGRNDGLGRRLSEVLRSADAEPANPGCPDLSAPSQLDAILASGASAHDQHARIVRPDGTCADVLLTITPVQISDESPMRGAVVVVRDISQRLTLERELLHSQKLTAVGQLAGGIAHDFNNLLGAVLGGVELLQRRLDGDPRHHKNLQLIRTAALRAADLTRNLLAFARPRSDQATAIEIGRVVRDATLLLTPGLGPNIVLHFSDPGQPLVVIAEASSLVNALLNIGLNARDAMPNGGHLTYAWTIDTAVDHVVITITDTGIGMTAEVQARIFEPFFTTKGPTTGTGLGLAMVWSTVRAVGGTVTVSSIPGQGSTFQIALPRSHQPLPMSTLAPPMVEPVANAGQVLLIDDDVLLRESMSGQLSDGGYAVTAVGDGIAGLELIARDPGAWTAVCVDVLMPGIDGLTVVRRLRTLRPDLPVLMISGFTADHALEEIMTLGRIAFLTKPATSEQLLKTMARLVGTGRYVAPGAGVGDAE